MAWNHACLCMLSQEAFYQQRHNQHVILFFIHVRTSISVWTLIFREFIHFHLPRFKMRTTPGHTGISISQLHGISTRSHSRNTVEEEISWLEFSVASGPHSCLCQVPDIMDSSHINSLKIYFCQKAWWLLCTLQK